MRTPTIALLFVATFAAYSYSQVAAGSETKVNQAAFTAPQVETIVVANRLNPKNLVACYKDYHVTGWQLPGYAYSFDALGVDVVNASDVCSFHGWYRLPLELRAVARVLACGSRSDYHRGHGNGEFSCTI